MNKMIIGYIGSICFPFSHPRGWHSGWLCSCLICKTNSFLSCVCLLLSHIWLFETLWTVAQRLLCPWNSPNKNTGVGCHFLLQGDLPDQGIKPRSPALQEDSLLSEPPGSSFSHTPSLSSPSHPFISLPPFFLFRSACIYYDSAPLSRVTWSLDCGSSSPWPPSPSSPSNTLWLYSHTGYPFITWPRPCYSSVPLLPVASHHTESSLWPSP